MKNTFITDFTTPDFMQAFKSYFAELGVNVKDWEGLFNEMNNDQNNAAYVRCTGDGKVVGFIQFTPMTMSSWFFEEKIGFIREFWVDCDYRKCGHGSVLLDLAEERFRSSGIGKAILTTDTANVFYEKRGYRLDRNIVAKNGDDVYVKALG